MAPRTVRVSWLRIGDLARDAGLSVDSVRHYEKVGVLPRARRGANGYREFPPEACDRLRLVRRALAIGFTLKELSAILRERDRGAAPCRSVRKVLDVKLEDVETRLRELRAFQTELQALSADWDARLSAAPSGRRAGLLESLTHLTAGSRRRLEPKKGTR